MGVISRVKREAFIRPWLKKGYSRRLANLYYKKVCADLEEDNGVSAADKKWAHSLGYMSGSIVNYREHLPELYFNIIEREEKKVFLPIDTVERKYGENYDDFIRLLNERGELVIRPDRASANRCAYVIKRTGEDRYELKEDTACKARMSIFGNQYDAAYLLSDYPDDLPEDFEKNPCKREYYDKNSLYELISTFKYGYVIAEPYKISGEPCLLRIYAAN